MCYIAVLYRGHPIFGGYIGHVYISLAVHDPVSVAALKYNSHACNQTCVMTINIH